MLSANVEHIYWRKNKDWYNYDEITNTYHILETAPERAKKSFELWKNWGKIQEEKFERLLELNRRNR